MFHLRRPWSRAGFVFAVALLGASLATVRSSDAASAPTLAPCAQSALRITVEPGDGLHHGVEFIRFVNVGDVSCVLSGYPRVQAILDSAPAPRGLASIYTPARPGARQRAGDAQWAWAGGVDIGDVPLTSFVAPKILLRPHRGIASATVNWIDGPNGHATCPAFRDLVIGVNGFSVTRFVSSFEPLCYEFVVTPIVKGASGQMFVKADYSLKANDLAAARDEAAGFLSEAHSLHREITHPRRFTIYQRMATASALQVTDALHTTPWPLLTASLARVTHESDALGADEVLNLVSSGYTRKVSRDYATLVAGIRQLDTLLAHLT